MKRKPFYKSTTFFFSLWAAIIITYIVFSKLDLPWVSNLVLGAMGIILGYVGLSKGSDLKHGPEMVEDKQVKKDI